MNEFFFSLKSLHVPFKKHGLRFLYHARLSCKKNTGCPALGFGGSLLTHTKRSSMTFIRCYTTHTSPSATLLARPRTTSSSICFHQPSQPRSWPGTEVINDISKLICGPWFVATMTRRYLIYKPRVRESSPWYMHSWLEIILPSLTRWRSQERSQLSHGSYGPLTELWCTLKRQSKDNVVWYHPLCYYRVPYNYARFFLP